jgi:hypothetical protein
MFKTLNILLLLRFVGKKQGKVTLLRNIDSKFNTFNIILDISANTFSISNQNTSYPSDSYLSVSVQK